MTSTSDLRVTTFTHLPTPRELIAERPLDAELLTQVAFHRSEVAEVIHGTDDRLLVVVGPCSIHDHKAALDYANRLAPLAKELSSDLVIAMRVYFEKPRTVDGWKGLINDPHLDGSHDVVAGLRLARQVLVDVLGTGLPIATEFLEPTSPQYIADTVAWGAIGARTTESQIHRQLASGLSMPIGFKNGTDGDVQVAVDGCRASALEQVFFGLDSDGSASVVQTTGNPTGHVVLRGGRGAPNFDSASVAKARATLDASGVHTGLVVDASHANSGKSHLRQAEVVRHLADQIAAGDPIAGIMAESFLVAGRQELPEDGPADLTYGQSITDACLGWETTAELLEELAEAVRMRRIAQAA